MNSQKLNFFWKRKGYLELHEFRLSAEKHARLNSEIGPLLKRIKTNFLKGKRDFSLPYTLLKSIKDLIMVLALC